MQSQTRQLLVDSLAQHGLLLRGWLVPDADDKLPLLPGGKAAQCLCLVGVAGSAFWPRFQQSPEYADGAPDPLDRWSRAMGEDLARQWQGLALFPFDGPPWHPFQRWADRCELTRRSPLGLHIHPEYGLWHAWRFALALPAQPDPVALPPAPGAPAPDLCAQCTGQPCLHTCPVSAFTPGHYAVDQCASHLRSPQGADCMQRGCQARRACPVAPDFRYTPDHAAFHMQAFAANHL